MITRTDAPWVLILVWGMSSACGSSGSEPSTPQTTSGSSTTSSATTATTATVGTASSTASSTEGTATSTTGATATSGATSTTGATSTSNGTASASTGAGGTGSTSTSGGPIVDGSLFTVNSQLASDVEPQAPSTVGIVTWSIASVSATSAVIEFGLDTGYGMQAPVDLNEADFRTLLLGMKPNSTYHFRIVASDGTTSYASDDYTLQTGAPTTAVSLGGFDVVQEEGREKGFIVLSYWAGNGSSAAFILDADGDIVWAYDFGMQGGVARARMSYDGRDMWAVTANNNGQPLRRVGMDGLELQVYDGTSASHDITAVSGDLMAYLDYSVSCDDITEIDRSGATTTAFTGSSTFGQTCHGNALRYSEAEDLYSYSEVGTDIVQIDRTGNVVWSLAEVAGGVDTWGGVNHGHHLLEDSMVIFANAGGGQGASAVIEYDLLGNELDRYVSGDFSQNLGDVQRLPGGNTLVDFSNDGVIHQIDASGTLLVEITAPGGMNRFGYATWRPTLYGPSPDITD